MKMKVMMLVFVLNISHFSLTLSLLTLSLSHPSLKFLESESFVPKTVDLD